MKKFFVAIIAVVVCCAFAQGQIVSSAAPAELDAKTIFATTPGIINPANPELMKKQVEENLKNSKSADFGPGDKPVFLLGANNEYLRPDETLELSLIPMISNRKLYQVDIQLLKPGYPGEFDGTQPILNYPAEVGSYGDIHGIQTLAAIKINTVRFNRGEPYGRYTFNIIILDAQGALVQQILLDVFLVDAGMYGPYFYINKISPVQTGLNLNGRFPTGVPIYWYIGIPNYGSTITGPDPRYAAYATENGRRVNLPSNIQYYKTTSIDVFTWSPITRYAEIKPKGLLQINN